MSQASASNNVAGQFVGQPMGLLSDSDPAQLAAFDAGDSQELLDLMPKKVSKSAEGPAEASTGASSASGSAQASSGQAPTAGWGKCSWDCGPAVPIEGNLFRTNPRAVWQCHACYNAARAIKNAAKTKAEKDGLKKLMADEQLWKLKVRSCRIDVASLRDSSRTAALARRGAKITQLFTTIRQRVEVEESGGVVWLDRDEYAHHMHQTKGKPRSEGEQEFDRKVMDARVTKMHRDGDEVRLPVMEPPRTRVKRSREFSKSLTSAEASIESAQQAEAALADLASVGTGGASIGHEMFGDFAYMLQPSGVVGSTTGQHLPVADRAPPTVGSLGVLSVFDGFAPAVPAGPDDQLLASQQGQRKGKRGPQAKGLSDCTGPLREARARGFAKAAELQHDFVGKNDAAKKLARALERASCDGEDGSVPGDVGQLCADYDALVKELLEATKGIPSWTLGTAQDSLANLERLGQLLGQSHGVLTETHETWSAARVAARHAAGMASKAKQKDMRASLQVYKTSVPKPALQFAWGKGMWASSAPRVVGAAVVASDGADAFDELVPTLFEPGASGVASCFREAPVAIGKERLQRSTSLLWTHLASKPSLEGKAIMAMKPKGRPTDSYLDEAWVPTAWRASQGQRPQNLRDYGAPWLLVDKVTAWRTEYDELPLTGIGQFWFQLQGQRLVFLWPVRPAST